MLLVLWTHLPPIDVPVIGGAFALAARLLRAGYVGVDLFFVLSGFLITSLLVAAKAQPVGAAMRDFYWRRSLRIFPTYYLTIAVLWWAAPQFDYWESALYISNYAFAFDSDVNPLRHTWSLAVEEQFYLLWPLLIFITPQRALPRLVMGAIFVAVAAYLGLLIFAPVHAEALAYRSLPTRMLSLGLGASLAVFGIPVMSGRRFVATCGALYGVAGIAWFLGAPLAVQMILGVMCYVVIAFALRAEVPALRRPLLTWVGKISYGMYLYHLPIYFFLGISYMQATGPVSPAMALTAVAATIALSLVSFVGLERPILTWGARIPLGKRRNLPIEPQLDAAAQSPQSS